MTQPAEISEERVSPTGISLSRPLGIDALDQILGGGLPDGNVLLAQGAPGTGKSILGMQFLQAGIEKYQSPGILITFEESPGRILRDAAALGWDLKSLEESGALRLIYTSPAVFLKDLQSDYYGQLIRGYPSCRIVIDSLTHFELPNDQPHAARERFLRMVNGLRHAGAVVMLLRELNTRDAVNFVSAEEFIADTVIQMDYRLVGETRKRLMEVLKNRGSSHSERQHSYAIAQGGVIISV